MKNKNAILAGALIAVLAGCASMTVVGIDSESVAGPAQVRQFMTINPRDITVYAFFKDDSRKQVSVNQNNITFDNSRVGPQTVRVRVSGYEASFRTEVMALNGISIASQPTNALLLIGEERNAWPGLAIRGEWNQMGSDTIPIESCRITGYNKDQAGRQTVSVAYGGKTASFNVEVLGLAGIEIEKPPSKTDYEFGEQLNLSGIVVYGNYGTSASNRRRELIPENQITVSGYDSGRVGRQQRVTVTARGQSANFFVNVTAGIGGTWESSVGSLANFTDDAAVYEQFGTTALIQDAVNKGFIKIGDQVFRNLTKTGDLTWNGQERLITFITSAPNVATGTRWDNCTITLNADGRTFQKSTPGASVSAVSTWTRR